MKLTRTFHGLAVAALAAACFTGAARADAVADFYRGKNINLIIGYGAGGGYDTYSRLLARHLGNHIPGNPTVVPKNMPGAGAVVAANFLANATPKDGTNLGVFAASAALDPIFAGDKSKAKYRPDDFTWIGNMNKEAFSCGVWKHTGVTHFDQLVAGKQVRFGATGPAAITSQHPRSFNALAGTSLEVIYGYKGTKGVNLAMRQGEVGGSCGLSKSTVLSSFKKDIDNGDLRLVIQLGNEKDPFFGDAAHIYDYAKSDDERKAMKAIFGRDVLGRPVAAAPGIPADRAAALRKAFVDTMTDPAFLADAEKTRLTIDHHTGAEVEQVIAEFMATPPNIIELARSALSGK